MSLKAIMIEARASRKKEAARMLCKILGLCHRLVEYQIVLQ